MSSRYPLNISVSQLSELIGNIYDAVSSANWERVLNNFANYTNANKAFCMLAKLGEPLPALLEFSAKKIYPQEAYLDYQSRPFEDPFFDAIKDMCEGDALYLNDLIDINEYVETEYYQSIFKPLECHYAIGGILCRDGIHESYFAVHRGVDEQPFSEKDMNLVHLIIPHFRNAMRMYKELKMYKDYVSISDGIIEQSNNAMLVLDTDMNVVKYNSVAERIIDDSPLFSLDSAGFRIHHSVYQAQFAAAIDQCSNLAFQHISSHSRIVIEHENVPLAVITVSPIQYREQALRCLAMIELIQRMPWQTIKRCYRLTEKELSLLEHLYKGISLKVFAEQNGTSYNTQRVHLQNVFKKLNVCSQTELMILLNTFK